MNFQNLLENIEVTHQNLQASASKTVNQLLTIRNWCIGAYIVEYEQEGKDKAKYGKKLLNTLANNIKQKGIRGLSITELRKCRRFYLAYPQIQKVLKSHKLLGNIRIRQTPFVELPKLTKDDIKYFTKLLEGISYAHFTALMNVENATQRQYYELLTLKTSLSVKELRRQINTLSYERMGFEKDKSLALEKMQKMITPQTPAEAIKDVYVFEFLDLKPQEQFDENDLENALIAHLQDFILELGNGFCFEARQKRILIGEEYFFVDLVFYHRILKCHVLIELKVDKMKVGHIAQLKTYLNYYDAEIKQTDDNTPIGILLVTDKNDALVQYTMPNNEQALFISKYKVQLPSEEELRNFIRNELKNL